MSEAAALAQQLEERVRESLNGLDNLLDALQQYPGRKTVVVLSGGMAVSDRPGGRVDIGDEAGDLGERAARANAVIYALHVDASMSRTPRRRRAGFATYGRWRASGRCRRSSSTSSLERPVAELLPVNVGGGDLALERVLREDVRRSPARCRAWHCGARRQSPSAPREDQSERRDDQKPAVGRAAEGRRVNAGSVTSFPNSRSRTARSCPGTRCRDRRRLRRRRPESAFRRRPAAKIDEMPDPFHSPPPPRVRGDAGGTGRDSYQYIPSGSRSPGSVPLCAM